MPGMAGVAGCCWAARESGANTMSESKVDARLLGMRDLSSERALVGTQRGEGAARRRIQRKIRYVER
jgi:hypothetical protein